MFAEGGYSRARDHINGSVKGEGGGAGVVVVVVDVVGKEGYDIACSYCCNTLLAHPPAPTPS